MGVIMEFLMVITVMTVIAVITVIAGKWDD